jgi:predicted dehydrogenase
MDMLRWGILGVAKINDRLIPGFRKAVNAELRAIASRSIDKSRIAAAKAGIPVAHGSYEELLDDPQIDAVYIPLPNHLHGEWTRKAADRGKHILCEKPLCPTAREASSLVEYCRARGVRLMDGFMWPHHPRTARLREFLDSGLIGDIAHVVSTFTFELHLDPKNIRLQSSMGGGSLLDVGCYPIYGIRWAFGLEPVSVFGAAAVEYGVDLSFSGVLRMADGRMGTFDCGFTMPLRGWMEIVGTRGVVRVPEMWLPGRSATFEVIRDGVVVEVVAVDGEDQIQLMIEGFSRAVLQGQAPKPDPEEGVKTLRAIDALVRSSKSGKVEAV